MLTRAGREGLYVVLLQTGDSCTATPADKLLEVIAGTTKAEDVDVQVVALLGDIEIGRG